jgi:uncharacterized membrane protein YkoI
MKPSCTLLLVALFACDGAKKTESTPVTKTEPKPAAAEPTKAEPAPAPAERLAFSAALTEGRKKFPDAPAIEVEVEEKDGKELLEVEFLVEKSLREVYLDPHTGAVVSESEEELDAEEKATLPKVQEQLTANPDVTLDKAITLAESKFDKDKIREIKLWMHEGKLALLVQEESGEPAKTTEHVLDPVKGDVITQRPAQPEDP